LADSSSAWLSFSARVATQDPSRMSTAIGADGASDILVWSNALFGVDGSGNGSTLQTDDAITNHAAAAIGRTGAHFSLGSQGPAVVDAERSIFLAGALETTSGDLRQLYPFVTKIPRP
jgi:hypothetical protein